MPDFKTTQMSYVVFRKAERNTDSKIENNIFFFNSLNNIFFQDVYETWPRVIEPIIDRKKHQHVRLCCPNGEFVNAPISKNKHGVYVIIILFSILVEPRDSFSITIHFITY